MVELCGQACSQRALPDKVLANEPTQKVSDLGRGRQLLGDQDTITCLVEVGSVTGPDDL